jgi:hypothetical protein
MPNDRNAFEEQEQEEQPVEWQNELVNENVFGHSG